MTLKQQVTAFNRTEDYDMLTGRWIRSIKTTNLLNIYGSTVPAASGLIASSTVPIGCVGYVYGLVNDTSNLRVNLVIDSTTITGITASSNNTASIFTTPEAPLCRATAGQIVGVYAIAGSTGTWTASAVVKIEPIVTTVEHI